AVDSVNLVPVSCMPSPESPVKRMATLSISSIGLLDMVPRASVAALTPRGRSNLDCIGVPGLPKGPVAAGASPQGRAVPGRSRPVFSPSQPPPAPTRTAPRALRPSLNPPVLGVGELPPGPASAAIACLGGPGGPRISLALRSLRSGEVVFFGPDEELGEWRGP